MKKAISFILALITVISLAGCGGDKKPADGNSSVSTGMDLNDDQYYLGSSIQRNIAEGPDAYYFFSAPFLYYMDKESYESYPLCGKPDCKHDMETDYDRRISCGAYHLGVDYMMYYDGKIYITELIQKSGDLFPVNTLNRYNLQGVLEKEIAVIPESANSIIQHRGTLYYTYYGIDENPEDDDWGDVYFMSCDLKTGEEKTIAMWPGTEVHSAGNTFAIGDNIYLIASFFDAPDESGLLYRNRYVIYNTKTESLSYIYPHEELASMCAAFVYNDKLVFSEYKQDMDGQADLDYNTDLYMAELDGTNPKVVSKLLYGCGTQLVFDDIILATSQNEGRPKPEKIAIYKDFELVVEFDLSSIKWKNGGSAADGYILKYSNMGDYIVFTVISDDAGRPALAAVKKSDLLKGKAEPLLLFEPLECPC